MKMILKNFFLFLAAMLIIAGVLASIDMRREEPPKVDMSTLASQIQNGEVKNIDISGDELSITLTDDKKETAVKENG